MTWPTWDSLAEQAINSLPTWEKLNNEASLQIDVTLELASVRASWSAVGKSDQEIMGMVKENLRRKGKL